METLKDECFVNSENPQKRTMREKSLTMSKTIRYELVQKDIKKLAKEKGSKTTFPVRYDFFNPIFVDVLEIDGNWAKLRLFYADGDVVEGWTWQFDVMTPLKLHATEDPLSLVPTALFDGRFNSGF